MTTEVPPPDRLFDTGLTPDALGAEGRRLVDTPRGRYVIVRTNAAEEPGVAAFEAWCPHLDGPLWEGTLQGDEIACPWHAWRYSLRTGQCTWAPRGDAEEAAQTELGRAPCEIGPDGTIRLRF